MKCVLGSGGRQSDGLIHELDSTRDTLAVALPHVRTYLLTKT